MKVGAWKSYDDLESNMTLEEMTMLYNSIIEQRIEDFKNMARANGATFEDKGKSKEDEESWKRVMNQVNEMKGQKQEERAQQQTVGAFKINRI